MFTNYKYVHNYSKLINNDQESDTTFWIWSLHFELVL